MANAFSSFLAATSSGMLPSPLPSHFSSVSLTSSSKPTVLSKSMFIIMPAVSSSSVSVTGPRSLRARLSARVANRPSEVALLALVVYLLLQKPMVRALLGGLFDFLFATLPQRLALACSKPALKKDFLSSTSFSQRNPSSTAPPPGQWKQPVQQQHQQQQQQQLRGQKQGGNYQQHQQQQQQEWQQTQQHWQPNRGSASSLERRAATRFSEFQSVLPSWLFEGLMRKKFETLKPIQQKVLPLALAGHDVVGIAPTGSGKTLAFLVPALVHAAGQSVRLTAADGPIALVLAPTRELAVQIGSVAEELMKPSRSNSYGSSWDPSRRRGSGQDGFQCAVLYGGPRRTDQLQQLCFQRTTHLVVATPGRLLDHLRHGAFKMKHTSFFVLDEGDRMLDEGFEPDVVEIASQLRPDRQTLFFSATWPREVEATAKRLQTSSEPFRRVAVEGSELGQGGEDWGGSSKPQTIELPGREGIMLPPREIEQHVVVVNQWTPYRQWWQRMDNKIKLLLTYLDEALGPSARKPGKALIFVGTRDAAEQIGTTIANHFGLERCGVMHGARKQDQRESTLRSFREGRLRALVATDVAGRGVDIEEVSHVVIFDFPNDIETYVHRIGRTGRNGKSGKAIVFFEPWCRHMGAELTAVLQACGQAVPEGLLPEEHSQNGYSFDECEMPWHPNRNPKQAPPLHEKNSPALAQDHEVGPFVGKHGSRVWGYSANGGFSEQGRVELRTGGLLRTTWGWGEWKLVPTSEASFIAAPDRSSCSSSAAFAQDQSDKDQTDSRSTTATEVSATATSTAMAAAAAATTPTATTTTSSASGLVVEAGTGEEPAEDESQKKSRFIPPPPTRPCPPLSRPAQDQEQKQKPRETGDSETGDAAGHDSNRATAATGNKEYYDSNSYKDNCGQMSGEHSYQNWNRDTKHEAWSKPEWNLSLTWGGTTDVVELDSTGLWFELVSRDGKPASTFRKKTLGKALPGVEL